tara:strand:+ start:81 stop:281 length:201 start_codon:yes stop_codon:yes gene_type:complete
MTVQQRLYHLVFLRGLPELRAQLALLVQLALLAHKVLQAHKAQLVLQVLLEQMALMVPMVRRLLLQ